MADSKSQMIVDINDIPEIMVIESDAVQAIARYKNRVTDKNPPKEQDLIDLFVGTYERFMTAAEIAPHVEKRYNELLIRLQERYNVENSAFLEILGDFRNTRAEYKSNMEVARDAYLKLNNREWDCPINPEIDGFEPECEPYEVQKEGIKLWKERNSND